MFIAEIRSSQIPGRLCRMVVAVIFILLCTPPLSSGEIHVAAASNFLPVLDSIAGCFERQTGNKVIRSHGSTGKLYSQIINGAPFDLFFAADTMRPVMLEKEGKAVANSRFTYAIGKLALWSADTGLIDSNGRVLSSGNFRHLAMANPTLAPFGKAAEEVLTSLQLYDRLKSRIVRGEDIGQTFSFVNTGAAELGFVSCSQITGPGIPAHGSFWVVPPTLYSPIVQQAVLLKKGDAAEAFLHFVKSKETLRIIQSSGYSTP